MNKAVAPENGAKGIVKGESGFPPREARCAVSVDSTRTENRLIEVVSNGVVVAQNQYDFMSRRVAKVTAMGTNKFVYDGWLPVRGQASSGGNAISNYYVWGLDLSGSLQGAGGVGGLLATVLDGEPHFSAFDANGNVTEYTDTNGTVVAHYGYDPFGNVSARFGGIAADFAYRFSTKYTDDETGLVYYGYRYYSPRQGRWLNRDKIGEKGGINLYHFILNDPLNGIDSLGLRRDGDPLGPGNDPPVDPVLPPPAPGCGPSNVGAIVNSGDPYQQPCDLPCDKKGTQTCQNRKQCTEFTMTVNPDNTRGRTTCLWFDIAPSCGACQ